MDLKKFLALTTTGALLTSAASAQIVYATDDAGDQENFRLDVGTTASAGPLFTGQEAFALADDDANTLLYVSEESMVYSWTYGSAAIPGLVVAPTAAAGGNIRCEAMAFDGGVLYAVDEFGGTPIEGIYSIDLVTGVGTPELLYALPDDIDVGGLDVDPATGLFYGSSDDAGGRGIFELDIVNDTETLLSPYPGAIADVDGLAYNPNGSVYLIQDEPQPIDIYDVATNAYTGTLPTAVAAARLFSAGTWSDGLSGPSTSIGTNYCTAVANSTGATGTMSADGSTSAAANDVTLTASNLPANQFGIFVTSTMQGFVPGAGGTSNGNLCLSGSLGRFVGAGQILNSGAGGEFSLALDLTAIPQGAGTVSVMAGETWNFQAWHRDGVGLGSNFTDGIQIDFN